MAIVNEKRCIGCGICAHLCPETAIKLNGTEPRKGFVPPPILLIILLILLFDSNHNNIQ